ncbi:MAG: GNAT family N-acetyltransferase [Thermoplasmata archaeon]|nr:GNAT family N-acetyltransferase [Thermoplasmata archaeon]
MFIGRLDTPEEAIGVENLMHLAFPEGNERELYEHFVEHHPRNDEIERIVAVEDGIVVGHAMIIPRRLCWHGAHVEADEIGFVATHPAYQRRGIMTALLRKTMLYLQDRRRAISIIYGIPYFYRGFGYEYAILDDTFGPFSTIPLSKIKGKGFSARPPKPGDVNRLNKLFEKASQPMGLYAPRGPAEWYFQEALIASSEGGGSVVFTNKNRIKGYARYEHTSRGLVVRELAGEGMGKKEGKMEYLASLKTLARKEEKELCLCLPPIHPLLGTVSGLGGERRSIHYGAYVKMISLKGLLHALREPMDRNMKSRGNEFTGSLFLDIYEQSATISFEQGKIAGIQEGKKGADIHIRVPPNIIVKLATGYSGVEDIAGICDVLASSEGLALLGDLFPRAIPYIWFYDR